MTDASEEYRRAVEQADAAMSRKRLQLSQNRIQPRIAWTLVPWDAVALKREVEAGGAAPFTVLEVMQLPRSVIQWAGAPMFAQYAYLLLVEVKAINVGG